MIQPSKRGRGSGSTNGGGGGGGGGNGTHVTLDAAQMAEEWRQALGVFGSVGQIVEWADTMRRVVSRIDDDRRRCATSPTATPTAAAAAAGRKSDGSHHPRAACAGL